MADPLPATALFSNDQRAIPPNASHVSQQLRSKVHCFAAPHLTAWPWRHQVPVYYVAALAHFYICIEVLGAIRPMLTARPKYVPGLVDVAVQCESNLRTGGANANRTRIVQRAWNPDPMSKGGRRCIRLLNFLNMHGPTVGGLRHAHFCKNPVLMNEKHLGMIELAMRHGFRPLGLSRAYHCGERANG